MLSDKEKKRKQHEKELNSFRNKMGSDIAWFDSLHTTQKYDLLFEWKEEKYKNKLTEPKVTKIKRRNPFLRKWEFVEVTSWPINFKHFIKSRKNSRRYRPNVANLRDATIDILLSKKNKHI